MPRTANLYSRCFGVTSGAVGFSKKHQQRARSAASDGEGKTRQGHGCSSDASDQEVSKTALCKWKHALQLTTEEDKRAGSSGSGTASCWSFDLFQGEVISARAALRRDLAAAGLTLAFGLNYGWWPQLDGGICSCEVFVDAWAHGVAASELSCRRRRRGFTYF